MKHLWQTSVSNLTVEYQWKKKRWNSFKVITESMPTSIEVNSEEEFITEHYWGYTKVGDKRTSEYGVEHPKWEVYKTIDYSIDVDFGAVYGNEFDFLSKEQPKSVFLAEGSEIRVMKGKVL